MASKHIAGINIKIGADTTGMDKAIDALDKKGKNTKSELSEINRMLKRIPDNVELWQQKQEVLKKRIEESREKVKFLEESQEQIQKLFQNKEIDDGQYRAFQRELEKASAESDKLEQELSDTAEKINDISKSADGASDDVAEMGDSLKDAGEQAENSSGGFTVLKGVLADLVSDGIRAAKDGLKELSENAMNFEDSMAKVSTIADATVPIEKLQDDIVELSNQTGISSDEIADNVYNAISAGQKTADAVNFVEKSTKLAKSGFADAGDALDILTTIMNAYGMEASEVARVSDVLIQTQNLGKTTVAELSSAMGKVIPTANANGVSLEQLAAAYAIMTANGVATAETTTYLNSMLNELGKSGTKSSDTLKNKTGKSFQELMAEGKSLSDVLAIINESAEVQNKSFADMWGSAEAGKAGIILLGDSAKKFNTTLMDMENAAGATETAFGKLDTKSYQLQKAQNQLKNTSIKLGSELLKAITPLAEKYLPKVEKGTEWMIKNLPKILETGKKMLPLITGIGAGIAGLKVKDVVKTGVDGVKDVIEILKGEKGLEGASKLASSGISGIATTLAFGTVSFVAAAVKAKEAKAKKYFEELTEESKKLAEKVHDSAEKMDELAEKTADAVAKDELATQKTQDLWKELQNLVTENGNVKTGYEDRVKYICNELTDATGVEIKLVDGQIKKYDELKQTIDETIKKQHAQRLANSVEEKVEAAYGVIDADETFDVYSQAEEGIKNALDMLKANGLSSFLDLSSADALNASLQRISGTQRQLVNGNAELLRSEILRAMDKEKIAADSLNGFKMPDVEAAIENLSSYVSSANSISEQFKQAQFDVDAYNEAEAALSAGKYDEAITLFKKIGDAEKRALSDSSRENKDKLKEMNTAVDKAISRYNAAVALGSKDAKRNFDNALKDIITSCKDGGISAGELLSSGIVEALSKIDGFDTTKLEAFIKGEVESLSDEMSKGFVSKTLSRAEDFIKNSMNGTSGGISALQKIMKSTASIYGSQPLSVYGSQPLKMYAQGGFCTDRGIVAEAGPELIEIINGGVKITPLTSSARNTVVNPTDQKPNVYYNNYTINATVGNRYDVTRIAEQLAAEQRRIEGGKGR